MSILGTLFGLSKFSQKHPLERLGCIATMVLIGGVASFTMLVQVLISFERRKAVTNRVFWKFSNQIYIFIALAGLLPFTAWIFVFGVFENINYLEVRTNSQIPQETIHVCAPKDIVFLGFNEIIFTLFGFLLPMFFICFNYG